MTRISTTVRSGTARFAVAIQAGSTRRAASLAAKVAADEGFSQSNLGPVTRHLQAGERVGSHAGMARST